MTKRAFRSEILTEMSRARDLGILGRSLTYVAELAHSCILGHTQIDQFAFPNQTSMSWSWLGQYICLWQARGWLRTFRGGKRFRSKIYGQ